MVSRTEGYQNAAGVEKIALEAFRSFATSVFGWSLKDIHDAEMNYLEGDFEIKPGYSIECKGQPIDPQKYPKNFVELFEVTRNPRHEGGLEVVANLLGLSIGDLISLRVYNAKTKRSETVGNERSVSVSIRSIWKAAFTGYINYALGGRYVYLYSGTEIQDCIRTAVKEGLVRGAGRSNEDTFAVTIPLARHRWERKGSSWDYFGDGTAVELGELQRLGEND